MKKQKTIANQPKAVALNPQTTSHPYVISIENLSDDKHYRVRVFNEEFDKNKNIRYSCLNGMGITYPVLLQEIAHKSATISKIIIIAHCDYPKFKLKQVHCPFDLVNKNVNGAVVSRRRFALVDPYQAQDDRVIVTLEDNDGFTLASLA